MNYDAEANIISWEITKGKITKVLELGNLIIHVGANGKPILVEILEASKFKHRMAKFKTAQEISPAC